MLDKLKIRIDKLEKTFLHTFVSPPKSINDPHAETCRSCGLNIRDGVHRRVENSPSRNLGRN